MSTESHHIKLPEGAKCIEAEEFSPSTDKIIDAGDVGGKVIDISDTSEPRSHTKVRTMIWVLVVLLLIGGGGAIGYGVIEEQEQQKRIETQRREDAIKEAREKAEQRQCAAEQRKAEEEHRTKAQKEAELLEAEERERIPAEEEARHEDKLHLAEQRTTPQTSQQAPQLPSQIPSGPEMTKRHYQGHIELTTKDGYSIRWEYNGYYTEEEFREIERQFYENAGYTVDSEKMLNLMREIQGL